MKDVYQKIEELSERNQNNLHQYLAGFVLEHLHEIVDWTIDEFAKKTNCSKPTVIRFCKAVDCVGFAEFKFKLKDYLTKNQNQQFDFNPGDVTESDYFEITQKTFKQVYTFYKKQKKKINKLIQKIATSRLIYIFGANMSYHFSKAFCDWLRLLGLNVIHEKDSALIEVYISHLQANDLVICFSLSGASPWLKKVGGKLSRVPNYKFGVLGLNSPMENLFDDFAYLPQFEVNFWNSGSIRAQALAQFLDYLYFDLSKAITLQK